MGNDTLSGDAGHDTLDGGTGSDTLIGGDGSDTYVVDSGGDVIIETGVAGEIDKVQASVSWTLGANLEKLALTGSASINGTGNDLANIISGNSGTNMLIGGVGDDTLDGGMGDDTLIGGAGNDTYWVDSAGDVVTETDAAGGIDAVCASVSWTLGATLENLTLTGSAGIDGTGNALANVILGNFGANILDGGAGDDTLAGSFGEDTYVVDSTGDVINEFGGYEIDAVRASVSWTLGANLENLTLTGTDNLNGTGNDLDNVITGNSSANVLVGGWGGDILIGGAGDDTLIGGDGGDTYVVDDAGDVIIEDLDQYLLTDTVKASLSWTLGANLENLTLTGSASINGTGNALANVITGNSGTNVLDGGAGDDTLDGGTGVDTLIGDAGNDLYIVDSASDVVTETGAAGEIDTVQASLSWTLGATLENLTLAGSSGIDGTGNSLANVILGNSATNILDGGAGNDTLDGGAGGDSLIGGDGSDTYVVDSAGDVVTETGAAGEIDTVRASVSWTLGANLENLSLTGSAGIDGIGNALGNIITGNSGANILDGGAGNDTLIGGAGNDTYVVDSTGDVIMEYWTDVDAVQSSVSWTLGANLENLTLTGTDSLNGTGNALGNVITGNSGANILDGGAGNDTLIGGGGADTLIGGAGNDTYVVDSAGEVIVETGAGEIDTVQASVSWTLGSNVENLTLTGSASIDGTGNALANVITGNSGANILDGGAGNDTLIGGAGNDTYVVDSSGDVITESGVAGEIETVQSSVSWTLGANLENLTLTGSASINGTGNALGNVITGNSGANILDGGAGNDTLMGGGGADTLMGGAGNDTYVVDSAGEVIVETGAGEIDTVQSSVSWTLGANLENLTLTGTDSLNGTGNALGNVITGNSGANILDGGAGNDTLIGGGGADTLIGGAGNDTYVVDSAGEVIVETGAGEIETVQASVSWTLGANLENLTLAGDSAAIVGTGNALGNVITGNSGANILDGGAGNDTLIGGAGNDTYVVDSSGDVITESGAAGEIDTVQTSVSWTLGANLENLTLTGSASINGSGNALGNVITGNSGANTLDGGGGDDALIGGAGNDTYVVDSDSDVVTETATAGEIDTVQASVSWTLGSNVENLILTGAASIDGTGNALANVITGNSGANILDGGAGDDTLIGGVGNDTYVVDSAGDVIAETVAAGGVDTVQASVSWTLGSNVENLTLTGSACINGIGNALANVITGNSGANTLDGGAGNDTLIGGAGNDTLIGGGAGDRLEGGGGNDVFVVTGTGTEIVEQINDGVDTVQSDVSFGLGRNLENLTLAGSAAILGVGNKLDNVLIGNDAANVLDGKNGRDTLFGGAGNDFLMGGKDNDTLVGGAGTDTLSGGSGLDVFRYESASEGGDRIVDFETGEDKLTFYSPNFGNLAEGTLSASAFVLNGVATQSLATFLFNTTTHALSFDADGNGAGVAVNIATFSRQVTLSASDILMVNTNLV